jgi:hypothetical protein
MGTSRSGEIRGGEMKYYFSTICILVLLAGCGAGSNLNIVSPSASDEEVRQRASEVIKERSPSAPKEKPSASPAPPAGSTESVPTREMRPSEESSMKGGSAQDALINLLERKGIITRRELMEEMKRLEQGAK